MEQYDKVLYVIKSTLSAMSPERFTARLEAAADGLQSVISHVPYPKSRVAERAVSGADRISATAHLGDERLRLHSAGQADRRYRRRSFVGLRHDRQVIGAFGPRDYGIAHTRMPGPARLHPLGQNRLELRIGREEQRHGGRVG